MSSSRPEGPVTSQGRPSKPDPKHAATLAIVSRSSTIWRCTRSCVRSPSRIESGPSGSPINCPMTSEKRTSLPPMVKETKSTGWPGGQDLLQLQDLRRLAVVRAQEPDGGARAAAGQMDEGDRGLVVRLLEREGGERPVPSGRCACIGSGRSRSRRGRCACFRSPRKRNRPGRRRSGPGRRSTGWPGFRLRSSLRAISSARWAPSVRRTVVRHEAAGSAGPPSIDQEKSCAQLERQASSSTS